MQTSGFNLWWLWNMISTILILQPQLLDSAQILGIFGASSRSHQAIYDPIVRSLAARGHNVTVISNFRSTVSIANYTDIVLPNGLPSYIDSVPVQKLPQFRSLSQIHSMVLFYEEKLCDRLLKLDYIKQVLRSKEKLVNLIIAESIFSQCFNLLANELDVPLILISPVTIITGPDLMIGNPNNPAYVPVFASGYTTKMSFMQRMMNTFQYMRQYIGYYWYFNHYMKRIAREHFNMELPSTDILHKRVSLQLYNNHFSLINRPLVPNSIDIAGVHMQEPKPLPTDIQEFIDDAEHGIIFFSFGTIIKASSLPPEKLNILYRVFSKIPQKVLWRIDDPGVIHAPKNVKVAKWFPQRDILEHKNVRAFMSHCGISSTIEAIATSTPVIATPLIADQFQNAQVLVEKGAAVFVDYDTLTVNELLSAVNKIINNTEYYENIQKLSRIFKDRPMSPLDTAVYWSEYVLRFNGAPHLRSHAADMPLYEYLLLDVFAFLLIIFILVFWLFKVLFRNLFACCGRTSKKSKLKQG